LPQRFSLSDGKILGKIVPQAVLRRILRQQAVDIPPIGKAIPYAGEQRINSVEQVDKSAEQRSRRDRPTRPIAYCGRRDQQRGTTFGVLCAIPEEALPTCFWSPR